MADFVDTNILIRLLSRDDPPKTQRCLALFQQARAGVVRLTTSESVIAEVVYVLASPVLYRLQRADVTRLLRPIIEVKGLRVEHKRSVLRALDLYEQSNLDFEDCLTVEHMRRSGTSRLWSYDRGFDRLPGVTRQEP